MKETYSKDDLINLVPQHGLLVAIDSDGCVFDSMAIKQMEFFHPEIIRIWGLEAHADSLRQVAEWVSLYSPWRGLNRFQLLLRIFQTLEKYFPEVEKIPETVPLMDFVNSGVPLSNDELAKLNAPDLQRVLNWSRTVSAGIAGVEEMPVFDEVAACGGINFHPPSPEGSVVTRGLEKLHAAADLIVVSQTTEDALVREWRHAGVERFVDVIAGAELGSKAESLSLSMKDRYAPDHVLMVGDAPGDLEAARAVGCLFFPIIPGDEIASWVELREVALDRVLNGTFFGTYQDDLIARFNAVLSDSPPWL